MNQQRILGIAASLRSGRCGAGNPNLVGDLRAIETKDDLLAYLSRRSPAAVEDRLQAGRQEGKDFQDRYRQITRDGGASGFSNSEAALAAALWAAHKEGAEIDHLSLADHFTPDGGQRRPEILRARLLEAGGLLVSGPVCFGDRGSLAESLIQFIAGDPELKRALRGRIYAGIAVGAKRNGGQETTLIYQMLDMVNLGLLTVGNDSDTTAQYGGTGHAGDVGTMHKDAYGIDTSLGTGRRMARVLSYFGSTPALRDAPKTLFLILQDAHGIAARMVDHLVTRSGGALRPTVVDMTGRPVGRCLACDICPTRVGFDEEYRCAVTAETDSMSAVHQDLLYHELIVPVGVSLREPIAGSKYQTFLERTRHIRRADFIWSDAMVAPLVLEEPGDYRSLPIRMMTSFVRHHTVMAKPMIGYLHDCQVTNTACIEEDFSRTVELASRLAAGRLALAKDRPPASHYRTVGYVLSTDKDDEDDRLQRRSAPTRARRDRMIAEASTRLAPAPARCNGSHSGNGAGDCAGTCAESFKAEPSPRPAARR
jgi:multimeric flavodoxin WrbA